MRCSGVFVLGTVAGLTAACGGSALDIRGTKFPVSSTEADMARGYEAGAPMLPSEAVQRDDHGEMVHVEMSAAQVRCEYWKGKADEVFGGSHDEVALGVVGWKAESSEGFKAWANARRDGACAAAAAETKKKADDYAAAAPEREARRAEAQRQARAFAAAEAHDRSTAAQAETAAGRCTDADHAKLEKALALSKSYFERRSGAELWMLSSHDYMVATDDGASLTFNPVRSGDYQILMLGTGDAQLAVRDEQGYPSSRRSARAEILFASNLADEFAHDTRAVQVDSGGKLAITVKGTGCALVMAFDKL